MKAILLAAGLGTRLKPLTNTTPKCLVEINGRPLLDYWLETLIDLGVKEILINLHHLAHLVKDYIASSKYRSFVTCVEEEVLLGTAGTLVNNSSFWKGHCTIVIHADNFCMSNLCDLITRHNLRPLNIDITMLLFECNDPRSCGIVELDENYIITSFHEKVENPPGNLASGALFVYSADVYDLYFSEFQIGGFYELSRDVIPQMMGNMQGWMVDDFYLDIGTADALSRANQFFLAN